MDATIPAWLMPLLVGLCVVLLGWVLNRTTQAKRDADARFAEIERAIQGHQLTVAKDYFSAEQASVLARKLDQVISELHSQNLVLTEVRTELRASARAAALVGQQQQTPGGHA